MYKVYYTSFNINSVASPSFRLLYLLDEVISPTITIVGHQWYWSYEYSDYVNKSGESIEFDSYMIPESDLELGQFRLLDVDNKVIVPVDTHIRLIIKVSKYVVFCTVSADNYRSYPLDTIIRVDLRVNFKK